MLSVISNKNLLTLTLWQTYSQFKSSQEILELTSISKVPTKIFYKIFNLYLMDKEIVLQRQLKMTTARSSLDKFFRLIDTLMTLNQEQPLNNQSLLVKTQFQQLTNQIPSSKMMIKLQHQH